MGRGVEVASGLYERAEFSNTWRVECVERTSILEVGAGREGGR